MALVDQIPVNSLAGIAGQVEMGDMDLGDLPSVRRFAKGFAASLPKLDLLINNAGVMACPESRVGPGWEAQFGTNHLGHMALALGLGSAHANQKCARRCPVIDRPQDQRHSLGRHSLPGYGL